MPNVLLVKPQDSCTLKETIKDVKTHVQMICMVMIPMVKESVELVTLIV